MVHISLPGIISKHSHPLDELSVEEVSRASACVRTYAESLGLGSIRFNVCALQEPTKKLVLAYEKCPSPETLPPRLAFVIIHTPPETGVIEVLVQLEAGSDKIVSWKKIDGVHALATPDDCVEAEDLVKADPEVRRILAETYDITDMDLVVCDPWSVHSNPVDGTSRCIQCFMYMRSCAADNQYAHPLDVVPVIDLNTGKIVRIDMPLTKDAPADAKNSKFVKDGKVQWNKENNNYHRDLVAAENGGWDRPPKPFNVHQPEGPTFQVEGNLVKWCNWSFRLGFNYREGIVLHLLKFNDNGVERPVAHRLSLVEMAVPYADPREPFVRKCAFDVGDYGFGYTTNSLSLGCDCLGVIKYFDGVWVNAKGEPVVLNKAVCMHEEDSGLLWKHVEYRTQHSESRRSRRLVISSISTVVNYEYAFYWYLYQDGTITLEIKLTGMLSTNMLSPGTESDTGMPEYGTLVGPGVNAQHHQHMFCARLDMSVDDADGGAECVVAEVDVQALPMDEDTNPHGNGFKAVQTILTSTSQAAREAAPEKGRVWKVLNPKVINPVSKAPVGYKLVPAAHPPLLAHKDSLTAKKGLFATKQLWVRPHNDKERFPSGEYVFNAVEDTGLTVWNKEDQALVGVAADPVLWYSFGVTHVVRVEDFPVMPVESCSFSLKPYGFFTKNHTIRVPPECNAASTEVVSKVTTTSSDRAASVAVVATCCSNGSDSYNLMATTDSTAPAVPAAAELR